MSEIKEAKVRFLSLSSLQTHRNGFLLAESALFTLPSLLNVADLGALKCAIAFFSSLCAFCHLADLRFSFFFPAFLMRRAFFGPGRAFPWTSTRRPPLSSNIPALLLYPEPRGHRTPSTSFWRLP